MSVKGVILEIMYIKKEAETKNLLDLFLLQIHPDFDIN